MTPIIVSTIVLILGIMLFLYGYIKDNDFFAPLGIVVVLCSVFLGFGLICSAINWGENTEVILPPDEIAMSSSSVFVKIEGGTFESQTHLIYKAAQENRIAIRKTTKRNAYNAIISVKYEIIENKTLEK